MDAEAQSKRAGGGEFTIRIKKAGEINMEELNRFLLGQSSSSNNILTG